MVCEGNYLKFKLLFSFLLILMVLAGCTSEKKFTVDDVKKVKLELQEKETNQEGISYTIQLVNGSNYVIKQNNVYVSFPIKHGESGFKGNEYQVEATGNKLNIQPGEKITLTVFMPFEGLGDKTLFGIDHPEIKLRGYMETVDDEHLFTTGGSLMKG